VPDEFTKNKRYETKPRSVDDVVNRNRDSVYQTDEVLTLAGRCPEAIPDHHTRCKVPTRCSHDESSMSTSMSSRMHIALLAGVSLLSIGRSPVMANEAEFVTEPTVLYADQPAARPVAAPARMASAERANMGGGFIEFLFGDGQENRYRQQGYYPQQPPYQAPRLLVPQMDPQQAMQQQYQQQYFAEPARAAFDPRYEKQLVDYNGKEGAGTIVVDTSNKFLYLVQGNGKAVRYGIGVGRPGFTWSGVKQISAKKQWPDWTPPAEMLARRPDLPRHMEGGPQNPLGARAMYLGSSLYRIHGSNEPWTIGTNVSSGCIRMRNEDVIDLYERVNVGTRVIVI
jgi:lipoprotein-anchoring transpeptidase ErfK/SrfK